jgi:hypothetical protein
MKAIFWGSAAPAVASPPAVKRIQVIIPITNNADNTLFFLILSSFMGIVWVRGIVTITSYF